MDLAVALTNLQQAKTIASVQIAVAGKILKTEQDSAATASELLTAADSSVAQAGDEMTAAAIGLGSLLDVHA
jgi:hypothetical protein